MSYLGSLYLNGLRHLFSYEGYLQVSLEEERVIAGMIEGRSADGIMLLLDDCEDCGGGIRGVIDDSAFVTMIAEAVLRQADVGTISYRNAELLLEKQQLKQDLHLKAWRKENNELLLRQMLKQMDLILVVV